MTAQTLSALSPAFLLRAKPRNSHVVCVAGGVFLAANVIFSSGLGVGAGLGLVANTLVCTGSALGLLILSKDPGGPLLRACVDFRSLAVCILAAFVLCVVGGQGHFTFSPFDFLIRDAVLADVVRQGLPAFYRHEGVDYLLRAPLGMYMIPAIFGRAFGLGAAHVAALIQNAFLYAAILYLLSILARGDRLRFFVVFLLFSGIDVIPRAVIDFSKWRVVGGDFQIEPHLMFWTTNPYFSHIGSLFWTPNHALPGWFFGALTLLYVNDELDIATLSFAFCALLFWSPLAMLGAAPFLLLCGLHALKNGVAYRRVLLAAAASFCLVPIVLYLQADSGSVPRGWASLDATFLCFYALTLVFSIPQIWLMLAGWRLLDAKYRPIAALAAVMLAILPFYKLGVTLNNDMTMRVSIVPLFMLGFCFSMVVYRFVAQSAVLRIATAGLVSLSAFTGMFEIRRGLVDPAYAPSDCNIITVHSKILDDDHRPAAERSKGRGWIFPVNYLARVTQVPTWMVVDRLVPASLEDRVCWPDYQLLPEKYR